MRPTIWIRLRGFDIAMRGVFDEACRLAGASKTCRVRWALANGARRRYMGEVVARSELAELAGPHPRVCVNLERCSYEEAVVKLRRAIEAEILDHLD